MVTSATKFKFSRCVCLQVPDPKKAFGFYRDVIGLEVADPVGRTMELQAGHLRLFVAKGEFMGPIMEVLTLDLESAKEDLLKAGCKDVLWEGKGGRCYMRDPCGFLFNVYEDPEAFQS